MNDEKADNQIHGDWGSWGQAEDWRKQSFVERTPEQRLRWLKSALVLAYRAGAIEVVEGESERK